ncbi:sugar kinase [Isoalcanivorax pacificus W11-5]|uniref:Sugar kinase n=1 Tax=Isoalcanivorax pacificus W11-5 TaxID=391936 RepID=A0A0B4XP96_9GAMM|nr:FGGY-family carbohydrate kinase [Isoalcanivorax pacificus]AJD48298.1 sugar kinase [Isoalcanivorax pacificus W11-5]
MNEPLDKGPLLLAIDQGTQSVRAMLFDLNGTLVARSQVHIDAYFSARPGYAEQHCAYFWDSLCRACQQLWDTHSALRERIRGAALTTQRASVVCLDEHYQPLRPAVIWLDQRRTSDFPRLPWWLAAPVALLGQRQTLRQFQSKAECNWLAADEPDIWARTRHFLLLSGYLTHRLTGRLCDARASQVGYLPFDFRRGDWAGRHDLKWRALRVKREQLPPLLEAGELIGPISDEAAAATGIPAGTLFYAAGADKACEVLGAGALTPDTGSLSYGTTATYNTCNTRYVEPQPFVPPYQAAVPGHYNSEIIVQRGYWMVNWFKREFAQAEVLEAARQGIEPEILFDSLLAQSPPGAMGLMLQPFWNPGVRFPGPEAKGAIIGFGDVHTRAHLYRAIIEGIGYALRDGKERLARRNRVPVKRLRVSGGGSQSDLIMQITADIFGLPAERPHTSETSGLGAAINAAVGAGLYPDHVAAVAAMTRVGQVFQPDPQQHALYERLYREVYRALYGRLSPLYRRIRTITGYPRTP